MSRGIWIAAASATLVTALLLLRVLGDPAEAIREADAALLQLKGYGAWAWAAAIALLCADMVFPVPAGPILAALGMIYGLVLGGTVGAIALMAAGLVAYAIVRGVGRPAAVYLSGEERLAGLENWFERAGPWAIVLTRGLPMVSGVIACLAGLARMPLATFVLATAIGAAPTGLAYAAIGVGWSDQPLLAVVIGYLAPIVLLPFALFLTRKR